MDKLRKKVRFEPILEEAAESQSSHPNHPKLNPINKEGETCRDVCFVNHKNGHIVETSQIEVKQRTKSQEISLNNNRLSANDKTVVPSVLEKQTFIDVLNHQDRIGVPSCTSSPSFQKKVFVVDHKPLLHVPCSTLSLKEFSGVQTDLSNDIIKSHSNNHSYNTHVNYSYLNKDSYKKDLILSSNDDPCFSLIKIKGNSQNIYDSFPNSKNILNMDSVTNENISAELCNNSTMKEQLQDLNNRLSSYMINSQQNSAAVMQSSSTIMKTQVMQQELEVLKKNYENELEGLRYRLESVSEEKLRLQLQNTTQVVTTQELRDMISVSDQANTNLKSNITTLERRLLEVENNLAQAHHSNRINQDSGEQVAFIKTIDKLQQEVADIRQKYESEFLQRQQSDLRLEQLQKKYEFGKHVSEQTTNDLRSQLEQSSKVITDLEVRVQRLGLVECQLPELVDKVREMAANEAQKLQETKHVEMLRYVTAQKTESDAELHRVLQLQAEKSQQKMEIIQLHANINDLQAQLLHLEHQKGELQQQMAGERAAANNRLLCSESKLRETYEIMSSKKAQSGQVRENVALRVEVEAYNLLLNEAEKRLCPSISSTRSYIKVNKSDNDFNRSCMHPQSAHILTSQSLIDNKRSVGSREVNVDLAPLDQSDQYIYQTDPSENYLNYEPANRVDDNQNSIHVNVNDEISGVPTRPVGPVVQKLDEKEARGAYTTGQCQDYHNEMFNKPRPHSSPHPVPLVSNYHDYRIATASSTGKIRILEVQKDGRYIRLLNDGDQDEEVGNYLIQQNIGGHPVAIYRFPPRISMTARSTVTVWSGCCDPTLHMPPSDFYWIEQEKWGTGPECTTILCRPNGQAIAWTTAAHRFTKNAYEESSRPTTSTSSRDENHLNYLEQLGELKVVNQPEPVYLKRKKKQTPRLTCHSPYASAPGESHPYAAPDRPVHGGNDGFSVNRQTRSQSTRPDVHHGQPYAGSGNPATRRIPSSHTTRHCTHRSSAGRLLTRSAPVILSKAPCPSPFMKPRMRCEKGLVQIQDQYVDTRRH